MNEALEKAKAEEAKKEPTGEMTDRAERRRLKAEKKKQKADIKKSKPALDDIDQAMMSGKMAEKKKARRKTAFRGVLIVAAVLGLGWVGNYLFKPFEASKTFAVCKIFLENHVRFPQYLRYSTIETFEDSIRIWYTKLDPYGEYRMENVQCFLAYDEERGTYFRKITIDRREVDPQVVERFNVVLPMIASMDLDLTRPPKLPDSLGDLQINTDEFRFQLNIPGLN